MTIQSAQTKAQINIIPEWITPKGITIVYPEKVIGNPTERIRNKDLIIFYDNFIQAIIENADIPELTIIYKKGLKEKLFKKFKSIKIKINFVEIDYVNDIWIRDWAPIASTSEYVIMAKYYPQYFVSVEKKYAIQDQNAGKELTDRYLNKKVDELSCNNQPIILDGGNFIHNGKGIGITTNRIISDNESLSIEEIHNSFKKQLGISKLIIVPVQPEDITGHIDGMVRFIDSNTIVVAAYPDGYKKGKDFMDSLADNFKKEFKVIRVVNETPMDDDNEDISSAFGNYLNYFRIGSTIFLPQYGIEERDKTARLEYEQYFKVIPISVDIDKLSARGGVLNCITWTYY